MPRVAWQGFCSFPRDHPPVTSQIVDCTAPYKDPAKPPCKDPAKTLQYPCNTLQSSLQRPCKDPGGPKRPPRSPENPPRSPQEAQQRPKEAPRRPHEASKLPPTCPREASHDIPTNIQEAHNPQPRHGGGTCRRQLDKTTASIVASFSPPHLPRYSPLHLHLVLSPLLHLRPRRPTPPRHRHLTLLSSSSPPTPPSPSSLLPPLLS